MNRPVLLSQAEIDEIREAMAHYPSQSAASIETLKIVQKHRRWVSDEALIAAADLLDMSPAELDSVATFYNLIYRKPVGKRVIHYCNSVSCWMLGAEDNREYISGKLGIGLGETTADGEYTLLPIVCLGACDKAPVLMVGDQTYFKVDSAALDELFLRSPGGTAPQRQRRHPGRDCRGPDAMDGGGFSPPCELDSGNPCRNDDLTCDAGLSGVADG